MVVSPAARSALREIIETVLLTLIIFFGVRLVVQNFKVEGYSMEPTMHTGQYLLVNKVAYLVGEPQRGDIIVFRFPNDTSRDFIKRVVGLPGETVEVKNGVVLINGAQLDEPYIRDHPAYTYPAQVVPPEQYFVLGDNRNNSHDSHSWGFMGRRFLIGKAWFTYWPWWQVGLVHHQVKGAGLQQTAPAALRPAA
jgi:signal peptidase I